MRSSGAGKGAHEGDRVAGLQDGLQDDGVAGHVTGSPGDRHLCCLGTRESRRRNIRPGKEDGRGRMLTFKTGKSRGFFLGSFSVTSKNALLEARFDVVQSMTLAVALSPMFFTRMVSLRTAT